MAAIIGRAAFLEPDTSIAPLRLQGPVIINLLIMEIVTAHLIIGNLE